MKSQKIESFSTDGSKNGLKFKRVELINHQSKVVAIAEAVDKSDVSALYFNVFDPGEATLDHIRKENGDDEKAESKEYWSEFTKLEFPDEIRLAGMSVITFPCTEVYKGPGQWQGVSDGKYLCLFRSIQSELFANRYLLRTQIDKDRAYENNELEESEKLVTMLVMKKEARYKRSKLRETAADRQDIPSSLDMNNFPFTEPILSFGSIVNIYNNWFTLCKSPAHIAEHFRWNFFIPQNNTGTVKSLSILQHEDKWLDTMYTEEVTEDIYALEENTLVFDSDADEFEFIEGPSCTFYKSQETYSDLRTNETKFVPGPAKVAFSWRTKNKMVFIDFAIDAKNEGKLKLPLAQGDTRENPIKLPEYGAIYQRTSLLFTYKDSAKLGNVIQNLVEQSLTIQCWVNLNHSRRSGQLVGNWSLSDVSGISLRVSKNGDLYCQFGIYEGKSSTPTRNSSKKALRVFSKKANRRLEFGVWNNIAVTFGVEGGSNGDYTNTCKLYINGETCDTQIFMLTKNSERKPEESDYFSRKKLTQAIDWQLCSNNLDTFVGKNNNSDTEIKKIGFSGMISNLLIAKEKKTQQEIQAIMFKSISDLDQPSGSNSVYLINKQNQGIITDNTGRWTNQGPPIFQNNTMFSDGMGLIHWSLNPQGNPENNFPSEKVATYSSLINTAKGALNLYASEKHDYSFSYNTKTTRAVYGLQWTRDTETGSYNGYLFIVSRLSGLKGNTLKIKLEPDTSNQNESVLKVLQNNTKVAQLKLSAGDIVNQVTLGNKINDVTQDVSKYIWALPNKHIIEEPELFTHQTAILFRPGNFIGFDGIETPSLGEFSNAEVSLALNYTNRKGYQETFDIAERIIQEGGYTFETWFYVQNKINHLSYIPILEMSDRNSDNFKIGIIKAANNFQVVSHLGKRAIISETPIQFQEWNHISLSRNKSYAYHFKGQEFAYKEKPGLEFGNIFSLDAVFTPTNVGSKNGETLFCLKGEIPEKDDNVAVRIYIQEGYVYFETYLIETDYFGDPKKIGSLLTGNRYYHHLKIESNNKVDNNVAYHLTANIIINQDSGTNVYMELFIHNIANGGSPVSNVSQSNPCDFKKHNSNTLLKLVGDEPLSVSIAGGQDGNLFNGKVGMLRLWDEPINYEDAESIAITSGSHNMSHNESMACWMFDDQYGLRVSDNTGQNELTIMTHHGILKSDGWEFSEPTTQTTLRINNEVVKFKTDTEAYWIKRYITEFNKNKLFIGGYLQNNGIYNHSDIYLSEIRFWEGERTALQTNRFIHTRLNGLEDDLLAYWPVIGNGAELDDYSQNLFSMNITQVSDESFWNTNSDIHLLPPLDVDFAFYQNRPTPDAGTKVSAVEYSQVAIDDTEEIQGHLKRCYSVISNEQCYLMFDFVVDELEAEFIKQVQSQPQLVGYIEGIPPLPGENMTHPHYTSPSRYQQYMGTSGVQISSSEKTSYSVSTSKEKAFLSHIKFDAGLNWAAENFWSELISKIILKLGSKIGKATKNEISKGSSQGNTFQDGSTSSMTNEQSLSGDWESMDDYNHESHSIKQLGRKYVSDNKGYALVKSKVVNLYALKLKNSHESYDLHLVPEEDIPEDVNVVMFPINPHYIKQGVLDGKIGTLNVLEGKTSYFKPEQAYTLENEIKKQEEQIKADYLEYNERKKNNVFHNQNDPVEDPKKSSEQWSSERRTSEEITNLISKRNMVNNYAWSADGGFHQVQSQTMLSRHETLSSNFDLSFVTGGHFDLSFVTIAAIGPYLDLDVLFGTHIHSVTTKNEDHDKEFALNVNLKPEDFLKGYNPISQTWSDTTPDGKVSSYRFKSFYLAPNVNSFTHFFDIIDYNQLSEENKQLIHLLKMRQNPVWRVLHRVTFVERTGDTAITNNIQNEETEIVIHDLENKQLIHQILTQSNITAKQIDNLVELLLFKTFEDSNEKIPISQAWIAYVNQCFQELEDGLEGFDLEEYPNLVVLQKNITNYLVSVKKLLAEESIRVSPPTNGSIKIRGV